MGSSKKLVFIGPPEVGKTTYINLFFKGQNSLALLNRTLEPTRGIEVQTFFDNEQIVVYDVSGQEIPSILESERGDFNHTDAFVVMLDISDNFHENCKLIDNVIALRDHMASTASIFCLFNKMDLIETESDRSDLTRKILELKDRAYGLNVYTVSIAESYLYSTLNVIVEIIQHLSTNTIISDNINVEMLKFNVTLLEMSRHHSSVYISDIVSNSVQSKENIEYLLTEYEKNGIIEVKQGNNDAEIHLTDEGKELFSSISIGDLSKGIEVPQRVEGLTDQDQLIYGLIIYDDRGRPLLIHETSKDSLRKLFGQENTAEFSLDLIPMYLNALHAFSQTIKIDDMNGFYLEKHRYRVNVTINDNVYFACFCAKNLDPSLIRDEFESCTRDFCTRYSDEIKNFEKTGNRTPFLEYVDLLKEKMGQALKNVKTKTIELTSCSNDLDYYKDLFMVLDNLQRETQKEHLSEVQNLKINLLDALIAKDYDTLAEMERIVKKYQE